MADYALESMRGSMRILDGTATPQFITLPYCQTDGRFPLNRPRPERIMRMDRGQLTTYTHIVRGDDGPIVAPIPVTFTAWLSEQLVDDVMAALGNPYRASPWLVGTATFVTATNGASLLMSGSGSTFAPPDVVDEGQERRLHVEWLFQGQVPGTNDRMFRHEECYFPPELQIISEGTPAVLSITYWIWGGLTTGTAYTSGTDRTPAIT